MRFVVPANSGGVVATLSFIGMAKLSGLELAVAAFTVFLFVAGVTWAGIAILFYWAIELGGGDSENGPSARLATLFRELPKAIYNDFTVVVASFLFFAIGAFLGTALLFFIRFPQN